MSRISPKNWYFFYCMGKNGVKWGASASLKPVFLGFRVKNTEAASLFAYGDSLYR